MKPYSSPLCSNCGRDKRTVKPDLEALAGHIWLEQPYCYECVGKLCREFSDPAKDDIHWQCQGIQLVENVGEHPARYTGYCWDHYKERTLCAQCGHKKYYPWAELCASCEEKKNKKQDLARRKQWGSAGVLCPDCKNARQHSPQQWCVDCLARRGIAPLKFEAGPWGAVVAGAALANRKAGTPMNLGYAARQDDTRKIARKRKEATDYQRRRLKRLRKGKKLKRNPQPSISRLDNI